MFNFKDELISLGCDPDEVDDWMAVRKTKRATNTKTAFRGFLREVGKSGLDPSEVVRMCAENSWCGFKASWLQQTNAALPSKSLTQLNKLEW